MCRPACPPSLSSAPSVSPAGVGSSLYSQCCSTKEEQHVSILTQIHLYTCNNNKNDNNNNNNDNDCMDRRSLRSISAILLAENSNR